MKVAAPVSGFCLFFGLLPACERKELVAGRLEPSAGGTATGMPVDAAGSFRAALSKGHLESARTALENISDEEYRRFLRDQLNASIELHIRRRATENPKATLKAIREGEQQLEIFWLEVAMSEFLQKDREGALAWHAAHSEELLAEENDRILLAIARNWLAAGDWRSARNIKDGVVNPEVKQAIADGIGATMEVEIRSRIRDTPGDAMKMLMGGESGFETIWIEVAINEYLVVDPKGAEKWYWTHGRSLTSEQHDRVALAYARAANHAGEPSLAAEWANQIKDRELRDVVSREIVD